MIRSVSYVQYLGLISLLFLLLERLFPWHPKRQILRPGWLRDLAFLLFNGHLFSFALAAFFAAASTQTQALCANNGWPLQQAWVAGWPLALQFCAFFLLADFVQWCTHILLHRIPWLWTFHKVHHSIAELDWIANFHFHWMEILVYKTAQFVPLTLLGASPEATFWVFILSTVWGDFNHSNINLGLGPLGYLFNNPRMHIWHHDISSEGGTAKNYGIVLSLWDFLFRTAYWPKDRSPRKLGYPGMQEMPQHLGGQMLWPLSRFSRRAT